MKKLLCIAVCLPLLAFILAYAQPAPSSFPTPSPEGSPGRYIRVEATNSLPKFDLDFPGGSPQQLVKAIEKVTAKPLNTIIPNDCKDLKIPAFLVKNVTVPQLFEALKQASKTTERYMIDRPDNNWYFEERTAMYGFNTSGPANENSIWYFYRDGEPRAYKTITTTVYHFYQLAPYLKAGYKVEDITTAIQAGWKMLGITQFPEITYHKDTKVLIAVGEADAKRVIGDVLNQLEKSKNDDTERSGK
jgi:hypothetical protein